VNEADLENRLLAAHAAGDLGQLVRGYADAADIAEGAGDVSRACFFLTHAWIFALEAGDPLANSLRMRLVAHGRETEQ
jgi:hypothetical protein